MGQYWIGRDRVEEAKSVGVEKKVSVVKSILQDCASARLTSGC